MTLEKLMEHLAQTPAAAPADDLRALRDAFVKRAGRISEAELAKFAELALRLLAQVPLIERMAFARQLARHRATPRSLLTQLSNDHYLVSAPVLEAAPMLSETDLTGIIDRHGSAVFLAIAKRDALSVQLTDRLMSDAEPKVQEVLAGNSGARLSRKSMVALCDLAEDDDAIRSALSRRRDLPLALTSRLRSMGGPEPVVVRTEPQSKSAGSGRAGIVLSAELLSPPTKRKDVKTFRYS